MHFRFSWLFFFAFVFLSTDGLGARRSRFLSHQGHIKGFNPCGWNTCRRPSRSFRRFGRGGVFARMRNRFSSPRFARPGCGGGSCQPRQLASPPQPPIENAPANPINNPEPIFNPPLDSQSRQLADDDAIPAPGLDSPPAQEPEPVNRAALGAEVFKARCQTCHQEGGDAGGPIKNWKRAIPRVIKGEMPPDGPAITGEDLENLKAFVQTKLGQ